MTYGALDPAEENRPRHRLAGHGLCETRTARKERKDRRERDKEGQGDGEGQPGWRWQEGAGDRATEGVRGLQ